MDFVEVARMGAKIAIHKYLREHNETSHEFVDVILINWARKHFPCMYVWFYVVIDKAYFEICVRLDGDTLCWEVWDVEISTGFTGHTYAKCDLGSEVPPMDGVNASAQKANITL